jgi:hypothetical protein
VLDIVGNELPAGIAVNHHAGRRSEEILTSSNHQCDRVQAGITMKARKARTPLYRQIGYKE